MRAVRGFATRVRHHVNPLARAHLNEFEPPQWGGLFAQIAERPLVIDVGCGRGRWVRAMAALHGDINFLGLEIRKSLLADEARRAPLQDGRNMAIVHGNCTSSTLGRIVSSMGVRASLVTVQFADPWFKRQHHKRRVLTAELCEALGRDVLAPSGCVFVQTDVQALFCAADRLLRAATGLRWCGDEPPMGSLARRLMVVGFRSALGRGADEASASGCASSASAVFGVQTEKEAALAREAEPQPLYRTMFTQL